MMCMLINIGTILYDAVIEYFLLVLCVGIALEEFVKI